MAKNIDLGLQVVLPAALQNMFRNGGPKEVMFEDIPVEPEESLSIHICFMLEKEQRENRKN